ncbi:hypothetical protein [Salinimonas sediminis]|uniref:DUF2946 domain-containing protein n=1 Tax=Salinimonas sediminis TaxID=2303538 RepID=A0A346NQL9_9ALTE|nr:hypothetical protein [Salinimonas sediminis]AXR07826.1 hypothetical protein D0Y50_16520 [Salinimonas sediminis]
MKQITIIVSSLFLPLMAQAAVLTYRLDTHHWAQHTDQLCHDNSLAACVVDPDRWQSFIPLPAPIRSIALKPDTFKSTAYQRAPLDRDFQSPSINYYTFMSLKHMAPNSHHQWHVAHIANTRPQQDKLLCNLQVENSCNQRAYRFGKSLATSQISAPLLAMLMIPVLLVSFYRRESAAGIR